MSALGDQRGRPLRDLRLSVTDRCNFRCRYCLPRETTGPLSFLPKGELLTFEELDTLVEVFAGLGVSKVRITGGEPLLRRDLPKLVRLLSRHPVELALTTNGVLLGRYAEALRDAGLHRVTVSLDALEPALFAQMCDAPAFGPEDVLAGIEAAARAGFTSLKINCVVKRSVNLSQVTALVRHFRGSGHELRFIEYMDVGTVNAWQRSEVVPSWELRGLLAAEGSLGLLERRHRSDVAELYQLDGLRIGFISSVSAPFCGDCSRARVTADGRLYTCLFGSEFRDLRAVLRASSPRASVHHALESLLRNVWSERADSYSEQRATRVGRALPLLPARAEMARIGG